MKVQYGPQKELERNLAAQKAMEAYFCMNDVGHTHGDYCDFCTGHGPYQHSVKSTHDDDCPRIAWEKF